MDWKVKDQLARRSCWKSKFCPRLSGEDDRQRGHRALVMGTVPLSLGFFPPKTQGHPEESSGVVDSLDSAMDPARHRHLA